jgi:outer membrane protein assembly factor BamB
MAASGDSVSGDSVSESGTDNDSALSHSAVPLRDRVLQEQLRRVEEMIDQREFSSAVAGLRQATGSAAGQQILVNQAAGDWQQYRDSHSEIERLLGVLPADSLTSYRRQAEPLARLELLKAVRDSNFEMLRKLPALFPETDAARDSLRYLAAWHLDRREFAAAKAVARRLVRLPNIAGTYREAGLQIMMQSVAITEGATHQAGATTGEEQVGPLRLPESQGAATSEIEVATTRLQESAVRANLFPSLSHPDWQVDSGLADEAAALTRHALHEHFEQSIPILPRAQPLVVDGVVVRRSLDQVSAYDLVSGQQLWASESMSGAGQSASRLTMNLSLQELMAQKLAQGLQVDSLQSRLSTDGDHVFTVESGSAVLAGPFSGPSRLIQRGSYQSQTQNRIVARHLRTGEFAWSLPADVVLAWLKESQSAGNDERSTQPPAGEDSALEETHNSRESKGSSLADIYFCGLPTPIDQHIVGLVQVDDLLRLYAADAETGKIEWSINIAEVPRLSPADSDWRSLDCRITLIDGVLVCPTGAGLIVGVDLGTRSVAWSRRTSRADMPLEVTRLPFAPARPHRPWWQGWRDNKILGVTSPGAESSAGDTSPMPNSILIAAGPDTDGLVALEPQTGARVWTLSVETPVDFVSVEDRIVVLSRHAVTAVDAASGEVLWTVPCREPVGTGYSVRFAAENGPASPKTYYVFPARGGSLIAVNCDDGGTIESVDRLQSMSGCLALAGDRLVMQNPDRISTWTMLSAISDRRLPDNASSQPGANDLSVDGAIDQAVFERSTGLFDEAAARLKRVALVSDSGRVQREHAKTFLAWINSGTLSPQRIQEVESEAEELVGRSSIAEVIELRHAAARAAVMSGDSVLALKFYAELQSLNPSGEPRFLKPEPLRSVRHDRLIQGEVLDLLSGDGEAVTERLAQSIKELADTASSSRDPFALQRFTRQWQHLPIVAAYSLDERSRIGLRYGQKQLSLLALADSSSSEDSRQASLKLIKLYESRRYHRDAAAISRKLLQQGVDHEFSHDGRGTGSPWNKGSVAVSEHSEQNLDTSFIPVPVECSPGSLFDRLNVAINPRSSRNDTILRFYGDGFSGSWQTVLATSPSPLKSVGRMYRGWGIGHFLVLQLGAELFGISPFDGSGEPRVQRLWSVDMADGNRQEDHEYAPAVPGFSEEQLTMLDAFGRPIVKVGPVRAGYLCFQTRGKLVCLDTATGQRLWQRYEVPRQAICSGDGKTVFFTEPNRDRVTVLRSVDGAMVSRFSLSEAAGFRGTILQTVGDRMLIAERLPDLDQSSGTLRISKIASVNLRSASVEWSSDIDSESTAFAIGSEWLGVLSLSGKLRIISSRTGLQVLTLSVQRPDVVRAIHVSSDTSSHLIALSSVAESEYLNGRGTRNQSRNLSVTGQLVAVDSQTGELKWQRTVEQIRFLIDQPKNAPCVVLSYRRSRSAGTDAMESVLHVIHRETGDDILMRRGVSSASNFTFEPHADQNRLSIRMARQSIRLTFAPRVAP